MEMGNTLAFLVFPYIALALFTAGHAYRYVTDRYGWNAKSSEFLEKENLFFGVTMFHWGVLLTLAGHAGGLLIPQRLFDAAGIDAAAHTAIAFYSGLAVGHAAFIGAVLLLFRRIFFRRIRRTTTLNDVVTLLALIFVSGVGVFNVLFGHYDLLYTVAPWIRGIVTFAPDPMLMRDVPVSYKIHILSAFALLAFSPFSRLVHIWSAPVGYFFRGWILFRRKVAE
ncbi:respiratory nitrate reductase subunit gamma [Desulfococcus sp.]|jgi:nitrate reductase gamma subunit|uniref:respiratory nitrate reductase subunit gamma n=1 Tax=Desulfococcus sp. TaxID=2025834 RepID=UPI00359473A4